MPDSELTREELLNRLRGFEEQPRGEYDPEKNHIAADMLLLEYINDEEISEAFMAMVRWYA